MKFNLQLSLSKIKVPTWLGPCASLLCLVHCFSLPILIMLIPGLPKIIGESLSHRLDLVFWLISATMGYKVLDQIKAAGWVRLVFVTCAVLGLAFLMVDSHSLFHAFLLSMAVIQLAAAIIKHRNSHHDPACCAHEHHHEHELQETAEAAAPKGVQEA